MDVTKKRSMCAIQIICYNKIEIKRTDKIC